MYNISKKKLCQGNLRNPLLSVEKRDILNRLDFGSFYSGYFPHLPGAKKNGWTKRPVQCPFHNDQSPSFAVNLLTGRYKCFACNASGSVFDFVMNIRGIDFKEAFAMLANFAGVIPGKDGNSSPGDEKRRQTADRERQRKELERKSREEFESWENEITEKCREQATGTIRLIQLLQKENPFSDFLKKLYLRKEILIDFQTRWATDPDYRKRIYNKRKKG